MFQNGIEYKFKNLSANSTTYTIYARAVDEESRTSKPINKKITTLQGISFKISGTQHYAQNGWNWYKWCNSEYNTVYTCAGENETVTANLGNNFVFKPSSTVKVIGSDIIQEGASYERTMYLPSMPFN